MSKLRRAVEGLLQPPQRDVAAAGQVLLRESTGNRGSGAVPHDDYVIVER